MKNFRELTIWQRSHRLTLQVYAATRAFPKDELYGLTGQTRRACASVPTNLAESCGRDGDAELKRFLQIAMGFATELEYLSNSQPTSATCPRPPTPISTLRPSQSKRCLPPSSGNSEPTRTPLPLADR